MAKGLPKQPPIAKSIGRGRLLGPTRKVRPLRATAEYPAIANCVYVLRQVVVAGTKH